MWECVAKTNMKYTLNEENISASTNIKEKTQSKLQWSCSESRRDDDDDGDDDDEEEEEDDDDDDDEDDDELKEEEIRGERASVEQTLILQYIRHGHISPSLHDDGDDDDGDDDDDDDGWWWQLVIIVIHHHHYGGGDYRDNFFF